MLRLPLGRALAVRHAAPPLLLLLLLLQAQRSE
jgi:hypothetical protein